MISKNSFLTSMKENLKRRTWVSAISILTFFFYFPVALTVIIQGALKQQEINPEKYFSLESVYMGNMGMNVILAFLTAAIAIFCAIQGFSYLYHRKKVDLYNSVPVSKAGRFAVIYTNGILLFVLPYLINMLLGYAVISIFGGLSAAIVKSSMFAFAANFLLFLCIYHITILAVMLTGNVIVTILATGTFLFYEIMVRMLVYALHAAYYDTFSGFSAKGIQEAWFSPIQKYIFMLDNFGDKQEPMVIGLLWLALFAAVFGVAAYLIYDIRPAQASGKALAFEKSKCFIKIAIIVPISLFSGFYFYNLSNQSDVLSIFGMLIGLLLSHALVEVIYEFDLRAALRKKRQVLYAAVITGIIFSVFRFDLFGYDRFLPQKEEIASVGMSINNADYQNFYDEKGNYIGKESSLLENMQIIDIDSVLKIAEEGIKEVEIDRENDSTNATVKYTLKNGKERYCQIMLDVENPEVLACIDQIYAGREYKEAAYQLYNSSFFKDLLGMQITFGDGVVTKEIENNQMEKLLAVYKEELLELKYSTIRSELPSGELIMEYRNLEIDDGYTILNWNYPVYPSFQKTIAYLKEIKSFADNRITEEEVEKVVITNYDIYDGPEEYKYRERASAATAYGISETFETAEELAQIVPYLYPSGLGKYSVSDLLNYDLEIIVYFKNTSEKIQLPNSQYSPSFHIQKGKLPAFVKEKLKYEEKIEE